MKIAQVIRPFGAFIFHILVKYQYKFQFWGPISLSLHRWHGGGDQRSPPFLPVKFHPNNQYFAIRKFCKFCENRASDMPLRGVYIPYFGQISIQISVLGVLYPYRCTDGTEEGTKGPLPSFLSNFTPSVQSVAPA